MYFSIKKKVYLLLNPAEGRGTLRGKMVNIAIITLIVISTLAAIAETVDQFYQRFKIGFLILESFSVGVFSIEYLLRIWTCTYREPYQHPVKGRLKYIFSFGSIIDLFAIVPFYLPFVIGVDFLFLRILRLVRFFRFFKLGRYLQASRDIKKVFAAKKEELVLSAMVTAFLIIIASGLMYFAEHHVQPDKFPSIPQTMWWSVATLTTVGSTDAFAITPLGKTITSIISILGVGIFALPVGILASGFTEVFKNRKKGKMYCPHCGKEIEH